MEKKTLIALVIPLFNEANRWDDEYWQRLKQGPVKLCFVNDGSIDNTLLLAKSLAGVQVLNLPKNVGKAEAVRLGMKEALNCEPDLQVIGFLDADGAFDVNEVIDFSSNATKFLNANFDALWSSRVKLSGRKIVRNVFRHQLGRLVSTFLATSSPDLPYDSQSGLKFYKVDDGLKRSLNYESKTRWFFELEHFSNYRAVNNLTLRVWEQPVETWKDVRGSKLYHIKSIFIVREIFLIWYSLRRSYKQVNS